jgi:predicted transposase YdaD
MHEYDVVLKVLLQRSFRSITGKEVIRWLPTELPKVQNLRIDLLGETAEGELIQIEVQSTNDPAIAFRMLDYLVLVTRAHGRVPKQILLYVGRDPLRMPAQFEWADGVARFALLDIRELNGDALIASPELSDNVLGILAQLNNSRDALRRILEKVAASRREEAEYYYRALLILAGLRGLETVVQEEAQHMSLEIDISENKVLGPAYRRAVEEGREKGRQEGLQKGLQEGRTEGRQEGRQEGEIGLLRRLIERKFGPLPSWAEQKLAKYPAGDLEQLGIRLLEAATIEDLLPQ